jgi:hypothetical protein
MTVSAASNRLVASTSFVWVWPSFPTTDTAQRRTRTGYYVRLLFACQIQVLSSVQVSWADAIQNHILWVNTGMLFVQLLALVGLVFYVRYTRDLREAAKEQTTASQNLLRAANDQAEGIARPCMTIRQKLRDASKTLLDMDDAVGGVVIDDESAQYVAMNIGNGLALNVSYFFKHRREADQPWKKITGSYLPNVLPNQKIMLALPVNAYPGDHGITFFFQSSGGRWYESSVVIRSKVIIDFGLRQLPQDFKPAVS